MKQNICNRNGSAFAELVFVIVLLVFIILALGSLSNHALQALAHAVGWV